ncbi:MAG TPA: electron transfer flavoprotein subunit beta/FixA family protein [Candidatus Krumholzibacteria bacterium]|jgi:electron transfer flavoprotein beta subunit
MKILCCVKQVPEKDARLRIAEDGSWIVEDGLSYAISECDRYGVEAALRLKEAGQGEVVVLSVGDGRASKGIKEALAMGCDRAIHVNTAAVARADALTIAKLMAAAVKDESFDVIICGQQSDDLGYNAVAPSLAHYLDMAHAQIVLSVESIDGGKLRVSHELDNSLIETMEIAMPVVLGVQSGINDVRYASLKGIMGAASKPQKKLSVEELGFGDADLASKIEIESVSFPVRSSQAEMIVGEPAAMARTLVQKLKTEAKVL